MEDIKQLNIKSTDIKADKKPPKKNSKLKKLWHKFVWKLFKKPYRKYKKLKQWLPTIWADQQWDGYYVYRILKTKLTLMREYFIQSDLVADNDWMVSRLKTLISLIDIIIQEDEKCREFWNKYEFGKDNNTNITIYLNKRNIHRYCGSWYSFDEQMQEYYKKRGSTDFDLRSDKASMVFWQMMSYYLPFLWD